MNNGRHSGFTLIEVLIVVIIMAVLAATVIPQFSSTTNDAKESSLKFNMKALRHQIEMYKIHHNAYPAISSDSLPQLTSATDVDGNIGTSGDSYPYGPYLDSIPANPFDNKSVVTAVGTAGATPAAAVGTDGGWQYDATTGEIYPNNADFDYTSL